MGSQVRVLPGAPLFQLSGPDTWITARSRGAASGTGVGSSRLDEKARARGHGTSDRSYEPAREGGGQGRDDGIGPFEGAFGEVFEDPAYQRRADAGACSRLQEVAGHDVCDGVVVVPADGQGEPEFSLLYLPGVEARLRRQYVIERSQAEAPTG